MELNHPYSMKEVAEFNGVSYNVCELPAKRSVELDLRDFNQKKGFEKLI